MKESKHTPEPTTVQRQQEVIEHWKRYFDDIATILGCYHEVGVVKEKVKQLVNACAGMVSPEQEIKALRAAIQAAAKIFRLPPEVFCICDGEFTPECHRRDCPYPAIEDAFAQLESARKGKV